MKIFVNGKIVDEEKAVVSVMDRGFLYGDGVFETMRSYSGRILALEKHLGRLCASAEGIGLKIEKDRKYIKFILYNLLKINRLKDAYIRVSITRGAGRVGLGMSTVKGQTMVVTMNPFKPYPAKFYKKGVTLFTASIRRDEKSPLTGIKTFNYLGSIVSRIESQKAGADDALFLNTRNEIAETTVSNIFLVKKRELITPSLDSGILPGITREIVLSLAKKVGKRPIERHVQPQELRGADEVFLTNTLMEVMPVTRIDNKKIGAGNPGPITTSIHRRYIEYVMAQSR